MLIINQTRILLQIFYELLFYSLVIFKSMRVADDTFQRNSECKWVNPCDITKDLRQMGLTRQQRDHLGH